MPRRAPSAAARKRPNPQWAAIHWTFARRKQLPSSSASPPFGRDGAETFDLLLLDVHMPDLDGFEVAQAVRECERTTGGHLPIIALTARSWKEDRERCLAVGMDDFLAKPIEAADLWAAMD